VNAIARTGTVKKRFRATRGPRACIVDLIRRAGDRVRFFLDDAAQLVLHPVVGDRMACELYFDPPTDDENNDLGAMSTVTITALHDRGFVDAIGYPGFVDDEPLDVMLRRYPERIEWKVS